MTEPTKEQILENLNKLLPDTIDRIKDEKLVELKIVIKKYALIADEYLLKKFTTQEKLLNEGNSHSKTDQLLRADKELFNLKRQEKNLSAEIRELKLTIQILTSFYWKNKS